MADGDKSRTYKLTDEALTKLEIIEDMSKLDKSDNVDRAIKLYWRMLQLDKIDDPYIDSEDVGSYAEMREEYKEDSDGGLFDRFRR